MASPFGCRSGHIPLSRKPPCPGTGRLARASALLLMHAQRNTTMRDCQPTPRGDGHGPWKLWLEPVYRADLMIYSTTSSASPNARDFAERSLWNIGLWRFHCALMPLVGLPRSASCAMIFGSVSAVLMDDFVKCSLVHAAPASSRESCPGAAVPCRPPWAKSTSTHPARSKKCAAKPPRGANRLFPINQLINRRWARLAGRL